MIIVSSGLEEIEFNLNILARCNFFLVDIINSLSLVAHNEWVWSKMEAT